MPYKYDVNSIPVAGKIGNYSKKKREIEQHFNSIQEELW